MTHTCSDCEKPISDQSKTGRCRVCALRVLHNDPEFRRRQREATILNNADPVRQKARYDSWRKAMDHKRETDPAYVEMLRESARRIQPRSNAARPKGHESRLKAGESNRRNAQRETGIPDQYWEEYRRLVKGRFRAPEARAIIHQQMAAEKARLERLSLFERQEIALNKGLAIRARQDLRTTHSFTLGGVTGEIL